MFDVNKDDAESAFGLQKLDPEKASRFMEIVTQSAKKKEKIICTGSSGGGMITLRAKLSGVMEEVKISPEFLQLDSVEPLEDLILEAFKNLQANMVVEAGRVQNEESEAVSRLLFKNAAS
jgi:DNA-binding protein YbaB